VLAQLPKEGEGLILAQVALPCSSSSSEAAQAAAAERAAAAAAGKLYGRRFGDQCVPRGPGAPQERPPPAAVRWGCWSRGVVACMPAQACTCPCLPLPFCCRLTRVHNFAVLPVNSPTPQEWSTHPHPKNGRLTHTRLCMQIRLHSDGEHGQAVLLVARQQAAGGGAANCARWHVEGLARALGRPGCWPGWGQRGVGVGGRGGGGGRRGGGGRGGKGSEQAAVMKGFPTAAWGSSVAVMRQVAADGTALSLSSQWYERYESYKSCAANAGHIFTEAATADHHRAPGAWAAGRAGVAVGTAAALLPPGGPPPPPPLQRACGARAAGSRPYRLAE